VSEFKPGDKVVIRDIEDFKVDVQRVLKGRVGVIQERPPTLPGNRCLFIRWQPKKTDRRASRIHDCPAWLDPRYLKHYDENEA
jgi:hypothetical protein